MPTGTMTSFGQYQVPETFESIAGAHVHKGEPLKEIAHPPLNSVLDQEDLEAQGIDTSVLIPGAAKVDALGSCTENAMTSALSLVLTEAEYLAFTKATSYEDTKALEESAIENYHAVTDLTGDPSTEFPPNDPGSSGPYIVELAVSQGLIKGATIAHGAQNVVSLLQSGAVLMGSPWLNAWMEPDKNGFIDGNGSAAVLESQIRQGVAGGHETLVFQVEKLALSHTGAVIPRSTIVIGRNSWTKNWGDTGCYRVHLSSLVALGGSIDFRQLVAK